MPRRRCSTPCGSGSAPRRTTTRSRCATRGLPATLPSLRRWPEFPNHARPSLGQEHTMNDTATHAQQPTTATTVLDARELAVIAPHPLVPAGPTDFSPRTLTEALELCNMLAK